MDKPMGEVDLSTVHLGLLTFEAHNLLSCLLNTPKTLLSEGPEKLPRDWRGLARLINISSEIANSYDTDKTAKVINYWMQKNDGTATIGKLLEYVQKIDRYDIFDDFMELSEKGVLFDNQPRRIRPTPLNNVLAIPGNNQLMLYDPDPIDEDIITYEDKLKGCPQFYHAYVMYALQDKEFVDEMLTRMDERGYKMCTEENLLPDHTTTFAPVSRLISSDRCHRIILVYSPDFLTCPANNFYMDYAQAVGIEMKKPKIIPCMFRPCTLPPQMSFYHKLWYNAPGSKSTYDFWDRLAVALEVRTNNSPPRINYLTNGLNSAASLSTLNITELTSTTTLSNGMLRPGLLALPSPPAKSASVQGLDNYSDDSQTTISIGSKSPKKKGKTIMKFLDWSGLLPTHKKKKEVKLQA